MDSFGNTVTTPIKISGGSETDKLYLGFRMPYGRSKTTIEVFKFFQITSDGIKMENCQAITAKMECCVDIECGDCFSSDKYSFWAGLTNIEYPSSYPDNDISVSGLSGICSETSSSKKNISIGGGYLHTTWIETEHKQRNVYYSNAKLPIGKELKWSTPVNSSQFLNNNVQAKSVEIASNDESIFIVWNVEINNKDGEPLETEYDDDHHIYCVKANIKDMHNHPTRWYTLKFDGKINRYNPPTKIKNARINSANVSQNREYDSWSPSIDLDKQGNPYIVWQNEMRYDGQLYNRILLVFWNTGWKMKNSIPYKFSPTDDCEAVLINNKKKHHYSPDISIGKYLYEHVDFESINIAFHSNRSEIILVREEIFGVSQFVSNDFEMDKISLTQITTNDEWVGKNVSVTSSFDGFKNLVWESDGNIMLGNYKSQKIYVLDGCGECSNPVIINDINCSNLLHVVYERQGDIYYWVSGCDSPVNLSKNVGESFAPSIVIGKNRCLPHVLWSDDSPKLPTNSDPKNLPNTKPEVLYVHLFCSYSD